MGNFADPQEVKDRVQNPRLQSMTLDAVDDMFIYPAEALLNEACNLGIDTNLAPTGWAARFELVPDSKTEFQGAMRRAVYHLVARIASNPDGYQSQSVGGVSVKHDAGSVPRESRALLSKWSRPRLLFRA